MIKINMSTKTLRIPYLTRQLGGLILKELLYAKFIIKINISLKIVSLFLLTFRETDLERCNMLRFITDINMSPKRL